MNVTFARRGNGSWFHAYPVEAQDGLTRILVEFSNLGSLLSVHTEPVTLSVMTTHLNASEIPEHVAAGFEACDGSKKASELELGQMFGLNVVRVSESFGKAGNEVKWIAPTLDCYPLQSVYTAYNVQQINDRYSSAGGRTC